MRDRCNNNDIQRQDRFLRRDDLSVNCNNDKPKVKAALGCTRMLVRDKPRDHVLTETDGPFAQIGGGSAKPWDAGGATTQPS